MHGRSWAAWVVCVGALVGGCSSSEANGDAGGEPGDAGVADSGPRDAGPPDAPLGDAGNGRVWFTTTLRRGRAPVADVRVCELDAVPENCAISNGWGTVSIAIPAATDVVLEFSAEGFRPFLHPIRLDADFTRAPYGLFTAEEDAVYYGPAGGIPDAEGQLTLWLTRIPPPGDDERGLEGGTAEFVEPAGHPVLYANSIVELIPGLTSTSSAGLASGAQLAPGTVRVVARNPGGVPCPLEHGGFVEAAPDAGTATVLVLPIAAGHETRVDLLCPDAP